MRSTSFAMMYLGLVFGLASLFAGCQSTSAPTYLLKIERGDTLASIAAKYDTNWQDIAKLNGLQPGTAPEVGSVIKVVPGPGGWSAGSGMLAGGKAPNAKSAIGTSPPPPPTVARGTPDSLLAGAEEEFPDIERAPASQGSTSNKGILFGSSGADLDWPIYGELSSGYGSRGRHFHHGVDIRARKGTKILAAGRGVVEFSGRQNGYGRMVVVRHGNLKTVYAHLASISVHPGDAVTRVTEIGSTGTTGNATGPHLHFEIRNARNQSIDPVTVIAKEKLLISSR